MDFILPSNWWVSQLQKSEFAVLVLDFEKLGLGLDNCGTTTKNAYCRIYSLWAVRVSYFLSDGLPPQFLTLHLYTVRASNFAGHGSFGPYFWKIRSFFEWFLFKTRTEQSLQITGRHTKQRLEKPNALCLITARQFACFQNHSRLEELKAQQTSETC